MLHAFFWCPRPVPFTARVDPCRAYTAVLLGTVGQLLPVQLHARSSAMYRV